MSFCNREEKRKAVAQAVANYMEQGMNKSAAVKKVAAEFGYLSEIPVWNAIKREMEDKENG